MSDSSKDVRNSSSPDESPKSLTEKFARLQLDRAPPIIEKPIPAGTVGTSARIQTNVFGLQLTRDSVFYRYDVAIFSTSSNDDRKPLHFTKKSFNDNMILDRHEKCIAVFNAALKKHPELFTPEEPFFYDAQSILFSRYVLPLGTMPTMRLSFEGSSLGLEDLNNFENIVMEIKGCETNDKLELTARNLCKAPLITDLRMVDQSFTQFLDLVIGQHATNNTADFMCFERGKIYLKDGAKFGFSKRDCCDVGDKKTLHVGVQKGTRFIEGPSGRNYSNPCAVVDSKKAAFHDPVDLATKAHAITGDQFIQKVSKENLRKINAVVKDLYFTTPHTNNNRQYLIKEIIEPCALDSKFDLPDGQKITVAEYYKEKYQITLKYPSAPLVSAIGKRELNFPMELCVLKPWQRVKIRQQTPAQSQKTTRECVVMPALRQRNIMHGVSAIGMTDPENKFLSSAGVKVFPNPIKVNGRYLPAPSVMYGGGRKENTSLGKWRMPKTCHFAVPSKCQVWALYLIFDDANPMPRNFGPQPLRDFAEMFVTECVKRGMQMAKPTDVDAVHAKQVRDKMSVSIKHKCEFIFFVTVDAITNFHPEMKLFERELQVVTQDLKLSTFSKVVNDNKILTLENIVLKTNCKLGGLNHTLKVLTNGDVDMTQFLTKNRMVVGIAMSNPAPGEAKAAEFSGKLIPIVCGYAANTKTCGEEFIGNYLYQRSKRTDNVTDTMEVVLVSLARVWFAEKKSHVEEIVVFRSGVAEGDYKGLIEYEIPLARHSLKKFTKTDVRLVVIVVTKEHNMRFFKTEINPSDSPSDQNVHSGLVLDSQVTQPSFKEYFLNSHIAIQGTARTPRYTVMVDDLKLSMDELETMTYGLSFSHQIVTSATSLPTPLYVATRCAERGRMIHTADCLVNGAVSSSSDGTDHTELTKMTMRLGLTGTSFARQRINA